MQSCRNFSGKFRGFFLIFSLSNCIFFLQLIAGELEEEMALWQKSSAVIWSSEELETLRTAVTSVGRKDWDAVAEKMGNKHSAKVC